jgi:hypothetical protein
VKGFYWDIAKPLPLFQQPREFAHISIVIRIYGCKGGKLSIGINMLVSPAEVRIANEVAPALPKESRGHFNLIRSKRDRHNLTITPNASGRVGGPQYVTYLLEQLGLNVSLPLLEAVVNFNRQYEQQINIARWPNLRPFTPRAN